jgi:hypothetical protein
MVTKSEGIYLSGFDLENLLFVLDYILNSEERSYEEYVFDKFEEKIGSLMDNDYNIVFEKKFYNRADIKHIYAIARRVKDAIKL